MFENPKNFQPFTIDKEEDSKRIRPLTIEEREELGLEEKSKKKKESKETASRVLRASWKNPENQNKREVEIDIEEEIQLFERVYDNLSVKIDKEEIRSIWKRNFESMKKEIETYGYDTIIIVPEDLPTGESVDREIIETMDEGAGKGKVAATNYLVDKNSITTPEKPKYRIILTKGEQNIAETSDPLLKATLGKSMEYLTGLSKQEIEQRIQRGDELPIDFKVNTGGHETEIKADGMSLQEYMIFQRAYFEKNKKHLDENGWTWLPKSFSGSHVVDARWLPVVRRLDVFALGASSRDVPLGLRLSRSFSN